MLRTAAKRGIWLSLTACILAASAAAENTASELVFACEESNDLYRAVRECVGPCRRYDSGPAAVRAASTGAGVLILADSYPDNTTELDDELFEIAAKKRLRVYLEYPGHLPGVAVGQPQDTKFERAVVTSDAFGPNLQPMRIMMINGCRFTPIETTDPHIVIAQVAGFDTAVYGLKDTVAHPVLFELPGRDLLVATTKLSHFVSGRYTPKDAWRDVWKMVLNWLQPGSTVPALDWVPPVRPRYGPDEPLPPDAATQAVILGTDWYTKGRFLVDPSWKQVWLDNQGDGTDPWGPPMDPALPSGDGSLGILEGHASRMNWDGSQQYRYWMRSDCQGDSALALALRAKLDGDTRSRTIAKNLVDYTYFNSNFRQGPRNDPASPSFGLVGWATTHPHVYYGDDNARVVLGSIGVAALLGSDRWDEHILQCILANFRTTGVHGFRGGRLEEADLQKKGWRAYWQRELVNPHPHYEAWMWTGYLWLYDKTKYEPLLERTRNAIRMVMERYPDRWRWTNGIQQERARMVLPLAWLIRVADTPEHRGWLKLVVTEMLKHQQKSGAIREEVGTGRGAYGPTRSNKDYGLHEAPLIQANGDPVADMLYTTNFAFFSLNEAAAATGDPFYQEAADSMADFLIRIQVRSDDRADLDGAWFRGFEFDRWEYWGSNADAGWGVWGTLTGWTQGWIVSGLALRELETSLWDVTKDSRIAKHMDTWVRRMIPDE